MFRKLSLRVWPCCVLAILGVSAAVQGAPVMQEVTAGGQGPLYTFYMSKYLITVEEMARFLNDAEANQGNARGANMIFGATGNVGFGADTDDGLYRRTATGDLDYNSGAALGSRYTLSSPDIAQMPAHAVTWFGAMKYCNWLTIDEGLGESERAYNEGADEFDWYPAHLTQAGWLDGFDDTEREAWLQLTGFRLPMDAHAEGAHGFNEWYKAASWNGSTNTLYGWGRSTKTGPDGNYWESGDPWDDEDPGGTLGYPSRTPVGFYDGSLQLEATWNWPAPDANEYQTNPNLNGWDIHDLSGNMWKWTADTLYFGDFDETDNRYIVTRGQSMGSSDPTVTVRNPQDPFVLNSHAGFHIVQVLDPCMVASGPVMQEVPGGGQGPMYTFYMSKYLITLNEWARFLNDAEAAQAVDPCDPRCTNMIFNADGNGNVGFDADNIDGLYRRSSTGDLAYTAGAPAGSRYTVAREGSWPVWGPTWFGAMKYCNWLTIDQGLGAGQLAYHEGSGEFDWYPAHLTQGEWQDGFDADEREAWLQLTGFRLPMDAHATGAHPFNEWYKAASWTGFVNTVYGWGRSTRNGPDGNYWESDDPWEADPSTYLCRTPVGFYDGSNQLKSVWGWPGADPNYLTNPNGNAWGIHDVSGNVWKWMADTLYFGDFEEGGNRYAVIRGQGHGSGDPTLDVRNPQDPFVLGSGQGFHIVQVLDPCMFGEPLSVPVMMDVPGGGQPNGPAYTFEMSKYLMTNDEWARFLNDAEAAHAADPCDPRGSNVFINSSGNVYLNAAAAADGLYDDILYRRSSVDGLNYSAGASPGSRYSVIPGRERMSVTAVTWFGAMKYCNWLTIDRGLGAGQLAYHEGPGEFDWYPIHLTQAQWLDGFSSPEREAWLTVKGYRLPMDHYSETPAPYNEWHKAGAWTGSANTIYGWGRNTITGPDGNYWESGDPWDDGGTDYDRLTPVGFYDGSEQLKSVWGWPAADPNYATNPNENGSGIFDMSGNVWKWTADTLVEGEFEPTDGRYVVVRGGGNGSGPSSLELTVRNAQKPFELYSTVGFHIVRVPEYAEYCGMFGTVFLDGDVSGADNEPDCYVNIHDVVKVADQWLECTDPTQAGCIQVSSQRSMDIAKTSQLITVNGDLSDWPGPIEWISLDKVYSGNPQDVSDAKFAARWDDSTTKVYLAVEVIDTDHQLEEDPCSHDTSDRIEIYVQGDPNDQTGWGATGSGCFDVAQQYIVGHTPSNGTWGLWADRTTVGGDAGFQAATTRVSTKITYEAAVTPFNYYAGICGGTTDPTTLVAGHVLRFDVIAVTKSTNDFGMLAENTDSPKHDDTSTFAEYTLVNALQCGDLGYLAADAHGTTGDCYVNLIDFSVVAAQWMWCSDPPVTACDQYYD